jgi:hypothetical protein
MSFLRHTASYAIKNSLFWRNSASIFSKEVESWVPQIHVYKMVLNDKPPQCDSKTENELV